MIIGITGTHGTGKTTFLYKLAHDMKIRYGDKSIGIISEIARNCPFPIFSSSSVSTELAQLWIFTSQVKREIESSQRNDIVLTDRTIFDVIAYTMEVNEDLAAEMMGMAQRMIYDKVYFVRPVKNWAYDDGQRSTNQILRQKIDDNISKILNSQDFQIKEISIRRMN